MKRRMLFFPRKRSNEQAVLVMIAVLLFVSLALFHVRIESPLSGIVQILSEEEYERIIAEQKEIPYAGLPGDLRVGTNPILIESESHIYYVPQSMNSSDPIIDLRFAGFQFQAFFCPDPMLNDRKTGMELSHVFQLLFSNGSSYYRAGLIYTGLPILSVHIDPSLYNLNNAETPAQFTLYNPISGSVDISKFCASYRIRGRASKVFPKKSYRFTLRNSQGKRIRSNLLDLGITDEWVLISLYQDSSRVRDKVCTDLWNDLCSLTSADCFFTDRMEFVELFIDGDYEGLYALVFPMSSPENVKTIPHLRALFKGIYIPSQKENIWDWVSECKNDSELAELKFPKGISDSAIAEHFQELKKSLQAFAPLQDPQRSYQKLLQYVDPISEADFCLFLQVTAASDQQFRNNYHIEKEDGRWIHIPYDLTMSFGFPRTSRDLLYKGGLQFEYAELPWMYFEGERLLHADGSSFKQVLQQRWQYWKTLFSTESLKFRFGKEMAYLSGSGALIREKNRWTEYPVSSDLSDIFKFIDLRIAYLDQQYENNCY